jgi:hypothetical protein
MISRSVLPCLRRAARLTAPLAAGLVAVVAIEAGANGFGEPPRPASVLRVPAALLEDERPGRAFPAPEPADEQASRDGAAETAASRPFEHRQHESLSCRQCHGTGERHRTTVVRSARDCAACHHDPRRRGTCGDCHRPSELPATGQVERRMMLTVWESARIRALPFAHEVHAALDCEDCHRTPVSLAMSRECTACHTEHHRPEANCTSCHPAMEPVVHQAESHLSCAASGCHGPGAAPALSRSLCIMCHTGQKTHEPESDCTTCHHIPSSPTVWSGSGTPVAAGRSEDP